MKLSDRLVDDWRDWHKWWSVRFAAVWAILMGILAAAPNELPALINGIPDPWRTWIPAPVAIFCFALPTLLRLWSQQKKAPGDGGN